MPIVHATHKSTVGHKRLAVFVVFKLAGKYEARTHTHIHTH